MLSNSCYLTTLFDAIALFRINIFIKSSLLSSWSMSRVWFAQSFSSTRTCVCFVCFDVIWLDASVEAINVSLQWTRHSLAILAISLKCYHLYSKTVLHAAQDTQRHCLSNARKASADSPGHFHIIGCYFVLWLQTVAARALSLQKRTFNSSAQCRYLKISQRGALLLISLLFFLVYFCHMLPLIQQCL